MDLMTPFDIQLEGEELHIVPRKAGRDIVYIVHFPGRRPPIMLTKATKQGGKVFWTTVPEEKGTARQEAALMEAEKLGTLIVAHYLR